MTRSHVSGLNGSRSYAVEDDSLFPRPVDAWTDAAGRVRTERTPSSAELSACFATPEVAEGTPIVTG